MSKKGKKYCIAFGCTNRDNDPNRKLFSLPSDFGRRQTWLSLLDREDLLKKEYKHGVHFVCEEHFDNSSIILTKKLKPHAVPLKVSSSTQPSTSAQNTSHSNIPSKEINKETSEAKEINNETSVVKEINKETSESREINKETSHTKEINKETSHAKEINKETTEGKSSWPVVEVPSFVSSKTKVVCSGTQMEEEITALDEPENVKEKQVKTAESLDEGLPRKRLPDPVSMETANKKQKTISESEREKARRRKLKYLANLTEAQKALKREKDREYFRRRMEKDKRKSIEEMSEEERNKLREKWRECSKKYRQNKKTKKKSDNDNVTKENISETSSENMKNIIDEINDGNNSLLVERPMAENNM